MTYYRFFLSNGVAVLEEHYELLPEEWAPEQVKARLEQWVRGTIGRHCASRYQYGWAKQAPPDGWTGQEIAKLEVQATELLRRIEELRTWRQ